MIYVTDFGNVRLCKQTSAMLEGLQRIAAGDKRKTEVKKAAHSLGLMERAINNMSLVYWRHGKDLRAISTECDE